MKRMNFPHRRAQRREEAEKRNAQTPMERTREYRRRTQGK